MLFNSFEFIWIFPIIFAVYYAVAHFFPKRRTQAANLTLLAVSYLLYFKWNPVYTLLLAAITAVTYFGARAVAGEPRRRRKTAMACVAVVLALLPLVVFKYYNFLLSIFSSLLAQVGLTPGIPGLNWAIPIGISFFTFQALGYFFDVYRGKMEPERNWWDYMLFVSFFPQIASGPISKAQDLLPQIKGARSFSAELASEGLRLLLWGLFLKLVVADRLAIYVDVVFGSWQLYSGLTCAFAAVLYTFQIYGDFAGYSFMAIGVARLLGFDLINNFRQPYLSASITEFWRRWHISLSTWLKDYVYIPAGGSRKGSWKTHRNILWTFLVSGIWHGANFTFIIWGVLHGIVQSVEKMLGLQGRPSGKLTVALRIAVTFAIVTLAWIFFRAPTVEDAVGIIGRIFTAPGGFYVGETTQMLLSLFAIAAVVVSDIAVEYYSFSILRVRNHVVRWSAYVVLSLIILLFGVLDSSQFIYVNF